MAPSFAPYLSFFSLFKYVGEGEELERNVEAHLFLRTASI